MSEQRDDTGTCNWEPPDIGTSVTDYRVNKTKGLSKMCRKLLDIRANGFSKLSGGPINSKEYVKMESDIVRTQLTMKISSKPPTMISRYATVGRTFYKGRISKYTSIRKSAILSGTGAYQIIPINTLYQCEGELLDAIESVVLRCLEKGFPDEQDLTTQEFWKNPFHKQVDAEKWGKLSKTELGAYRRKHKSMICQAAKDALKEDKFIILDNTSFENK